VRRRPDYYETSVFIPMVGFVVLAASSWSVVPRYDSATAERLSVSITMVLTATAYKIVVASFLPMVSYRTVIDNFTNGHEYFLMLIVLENSIIGTSWEMEWHSVDEPRAIEQYCIPLIMLLYFVYLVYYYFKTNRLRKQGFDILKAAEDFKALSKGDSSLKSKQQADWPAQGDPHDKLVQILGGLSEHEIAELHRKMDHDKNGVCDLSEFEAELVRRGVNTKNEAIARILLDADVDGDGEISLDELIKLSKKLTETTQKT
jgi:hypothetical protein